MLSYEVPQHLDAPSRLLIWTLDECIALFVSFFLVFLVADAPIVALLLGTVSLLGLKKLKGNQGAYFLYQWAYWVLPPVVRFRYLPPSAIRHWLG